MDWRRVAAGVGRAMIGAGVLVLLFVAYQLWGTGLQEARAQRSLERDFARQLAEAPGPASPTTAAVPVATTVTPATSPGPSTTTTAAPAPSTAVASPPVEVESGEALARIEIPAIGVDKIVVAGVDVADLRKGPGHYPTTPLPGQLGNAAIAGHRTTYGAPFSRIDELAPGDEIVVTTVQGRFRYLVFGQRVVAPTDLSVLDPTPDATLTLTSCHPRFSARQRIVVQARLEPEPAVAPSPPTPPASSAPPDGGPPPVVDNPVVGTDAPEEAAGSHVDPLADGWFSDASAWWPAIGWSLVCLVLADAAWLIAQRWRRWPTYLLAAPVLLVALYVCFGDIARLLPPNL